MTQQIRIRNWSLQKAHGMYLKRSVTKTGFGTVDRIEKFKKWELNKSYTFAVSKSISGILKLVNGSENYSF